VLFLDRSHARARAYIDRARTALAERQRRADQILQETDASIVRGDAAAARELLTRAEAAMADEAQAAGLRQRLERLETTRPGETTQVPTRIESEPAARGTDLNRWWLIVPATLLVGAVVGVALNQRARAWLGMSAAASPSPASEPQPPVVLTTDDVAMTRATTLMNQGRLAEALRSLDRIPPESDHAAEANDLRLRIQRLLLVDRIPRGAIQGTAPGIQP
jgi:hypothetical protein